MALVFEDRQSTRPGRYKIIPETGEPYYVTMERADEPIVMGTPLNAEAFNSLVSKSGDKMAGMLEFENLDAYHALMKYRYINEQTYGMNVGCGILGGKGIVCFEVREGNETTSPRLGRLEVGELGVSYVAPDGKRTYLFESGVASTTLE